MLHEVCLMNTFQQAFVWLDFVGNDNRRIAFWITVLLVHSQLTNMAGRHTKIYEWEIYRCFIKWQSLKRIFPERRENNGIIVCRTTPQMSPWISLALDSCQIISVINPVKSSYRDHGMPYRRIFTPSSYFPPLLRLAKCNLHVSIIFGKYGGVNRCCSPLNYNV